jgi:hypothetical protein
VIKRDVCVTVYLSALITHKLITSTSNISFSKAGDAYTEAINNDMGSRDRGTRDREGWERDQVLSLKLCNELLTKTFLTQLILNPFQPYVLSYISKLV